MVFLSTTWTLVRLPDAAVQESHERVQTAIKNAGLHFPRHRIVVNLAPASVRKEGPAYDLPIALDVIILSGRLPLEAVEDTLVIGELSLDGILPMVVAARANGFKRMVVLEVDRVAILLISKFILPKIRKNHMTSILKDSDI